MLLRFSRSETDFDFKFFNIFYGKIKIKCGSFKLEPTGGATNGAGPPDSNVKCFTYKIYFHFRRSISCMGRHVTILIISLRYDDVTGWYKHKTKI